ncbi:MAG: amidohydrolase [Erysipelotrichaceae bacterium]|nr:amidohydrolase [Erysipelotrichaceae bacterium]
MENIYRLITEKADQLLPQMIELRRGFHRYAETGWLEIRTASVIADRLTRMGYEVLIGSQVMKEDERMGIPDQNVLEAAYRRALEQGAIQPYAEMVKDAHTCVVGVLKCGPGPVIGMRFDIDALGVYESEEETHFPTHEGFRSVNEGSMHACGPDGHASIGLGVAEILMSIKEQLHGTVKLVFQPAEEGVRGARSIAAGGILDDVDYMLGNHLAAGDYPDHLIGLSNGHSLATTKLDAYFHGTACHAGKPNEGDNAMLAAATAVMNLHAIPRFSNETTRINVGTLHAGSGRNVICDRAKLELEVRGSTTEANEYMETYARRIIEAAAQMHGCTSEIKIMGSAPSLSSDEEMNRLCQMVCTEKLNITCDEPKDESNGSEDYSYMADRVRAHGGKSLFFYTNSKMAGKAHSTTFNFSEESLATAVKVFCGLTVHLMRS